MKVGIIGSGGREHAICHALYSSKKVEIIYCFPGNAGTSTIAKNNSLNLENFNELKDFIITNKIDLIIVGPEKPLVEGMVDFLEMHNIKVFGPNKLASQLEGSKIFTKNLCKKHNIPTAKFGIFEKIKDAIEFIEKTKYPLVIRADGLASGKGVYICDEKKEAEIAIKEIFAGKFGVAKNLLIEEFLKGEEMSYFIITDGKTIKRFDTAQDHKRVLEGDKGKNTGGMGAYSPSRLINEKLDFACNNNPPSFPEGLDVEVFTFNSLKKAYKNVKSDFDKEHVTQFFHDNQNIFKQKNLISRDDLSSYRWTIDYQEDYDMIKVIYDKLYLPNQIFHTKEIIELIKKNPEIKNINLISLRSHRYRRKG